MRLSGSNNSYLDEIAAKINAADSASDYSAKGYLREAQALLRDYGSKLTSSEINMCEAEIDRIADERNIDL